jgi:hypothetical protein
VPVKAPAPEASVTHERVVPLPVKTCPAEQFGRALLHESRAS